MTKPGTEKRAAIVRVKTAERAEEIISLYNKHGWQVIAGIEPDKPEDVSDVERLINPLMPIRGKVKVGRNDPSPCGSGLKFKKCCLKKHE